MYLMADAGIATAKRGATLTVDGIDGGVRGAGCGASLRVRHLPLITDY